MCGIVGLRDLNCEPEDAKNRLEAAIADLRRRGPDADGLYLHPPLYLGHTRLSIIDLSDNARQPMVDRSGEYVIVFNGEIYNYRELYSAYCPRDGTVNGSSDTAVLLHLYTRFGRDCLHLLDGMFAFAVVHLRDGTIFLARDRFGEKPLYVLMEGNIVAFSSELRALRKLLPERNWSIDRIAQALYHILGSVPAPYTIFCGVRAVLPASWMEIAADDRVSGGTYWSLSDDAAGAAPCQTYEEAVHETRRLLRNAVSSRLTSDVPVGMFLSGGFDSGSIAGLCEAVGRPQEHALCIDFAENDYSEFETAQATAAHYGAKLYREVIRASDFLAQLDDFFYSMDQPTHDGFNTYCVCKAAKRFGVKVWLSGVGGDELFGGYPSFRLIPFLLKLSRLMQHAIIRHCADWFSPHLWSYLKLSRLLHLSDSGDTRLRGFHLLRNIIPWRNSVEILGTDAVHWHEILQTLDSVYPGAKDLRDDFQTASLFESRVYMGYMLLRDMDNFSMAHSLELRAPFLDHRLFSFVFSLPAQYKQNNHRTKPLLADALPKPLPTLTAQLPKRGFTFPEIWLRQELRAEFESAVLDNSNTEYFQPVIVRNMWDAYLSGRLPGSVLWNIFSFARWRLLQGL